MLYDYLVIIQKSSQVPNVSFMSVPLLTTGLDFVTKYSSSVLWSLLKADKFMWIHTSWQE